MCKRAMLLLSLTLALMAGTSDICNSAQPLPEERLPPEILAALERAPITTSIQSVSGILKFDKQILKADQVVFQGNSIIELVGNNYPFRAIVAEKIRFASPSGSAVIRRDQSLNAKNGILRLAGFEECKGRSGIRLIVCLATPIAGDGETISLPPLIIYARSVEVVGAVGDAPNGNLVIEMTGIDGGAGSNGRTGSAGEAGQDGRDSSSGVLDCRRGARSGEMAAVGNRGAEEAAEGREEMEQMFF